MKTIKELLEIMLDSEHLFTYGLCSWVYDLYTDNQYTWHEYFDFISYLRENKPSILNDDGYWWKKKDITPRIEWIKEHIKLNEK